MQTNGFIYFLIGAFLGSMVVGIILSRNFSKDTPNTPLTESKSGPVVQSQQKKKIEVPKDETGTGFEDSIITRPGFHILSEFDKVQTPDDYESFIKEFGGKKQWIYVIAAKKRDKTLWDKFWNFDYTANKELQTIFPSPESFKSYIDEFFGKILTDSVEYDGGDLSIIFNSSKNSLDSAKKLTDKSVDPEFFKQLIYVYRSTKDNNLCDQINKEKSSSLYNLCDELNK